MAILFHRLFDDAAIFPPGNAAMPDAVTRHVDWCASPRGVYVGPFVCSSARWSELAESLAPAGASGISVAVTVPDVSAVQDAVAAAREEPRASLASVEVPVADHAGLDHALTVLDKVLPADVPGFVEPPWSAIDADACTRLAASRHQLKIRTGGASAESFPSEDLLVTMLSCAVRHQVPFKLTAGLHNAVRHRDPATGFEHHGFLNVIAATASVLDGEDDSTAQSLLAIQNPKQLAELVRRLRPQAARDVRRQFVSFGTCSIDEPLRDLSDLRLLD